jgi:hypothetical protein
MKETPHAPSLGEADGILYCKLDRLAKDEDVRDTRKVAAGRKL